MSTRCQTCVKSERCVDGCTGYVPTAEATADREAYLQDMADARRKGEL